MRRYTCDRRTPWRLKSSIVFKFKGREREEIEDKGVFSLSPYFTTYCLPYRYLQFPDKKIALYEMIVLTEELMSLGSFGSKKKNRKIANGLSNLKERLKKEEANEST